MLLSVQLNTTQGNKKPPTITIRPCYTNDTPERCPRAPYLKRYKSK